MKLLLRTKLFYLNEFIILKSYVQVVDSKVQLLSRESFQKLHANLLLNDKSFQKPAAQLNPS